MNSQTTEYSLCNLDSSSHNYAVSAFTEANCYYSASEGNGGHFEHYDGTYGGHFGPNDFYFPSQNESCAPNHGPSNFCTFSSSSSGNEASKLAASSENQQQNDQAATYKWMTVKRSNPKTSKSREL